MRHFPAFLKLDGRTVLVLGLGEVSDRKAEPLAAAGAVLRRAARFTPELLDGCALAVGADAPEAELFALSEAAQARGIPVNIVDRPELCSFIMPAIIERDDVTVAVSTGGAAPVLARMIRSRIEAALPPMIGRVAALGEKFQAAVRARLPNLPARRAFLERAFSGRPAELAQAGRQAEAEAAFAEQLESADVTPPGMVYLVGGGPGAADLLTLRAQRLLGEADVIVHDKLVGEAVMAMARRDAERIFVGKSRANHCLPQEEINRLLVRLARQGKRVVRLKGGDPFVFGRGGEEAQELAREGVAFEVVPGVTAALACAAQAGIPLTHRGVARVLTFVTGHTKEGRLDLDFAALARPGQTLAIYMGITTMPQLLEGLTSHGLPAATPAALIERGGTPDQRELRGPLAQLVAQAPGWVAGGPALLVIGEAVAEAALVSAARDVAMC
ncbi:uroporphyrinogen-III C-methyltransferase [Rhodovarius crocodyli]|uniref:Uroporphyrinogen-III C-methyltransferase n=1 Tax=Rhodovarius crocodyli TaxID=1979269 RepID=A0A437MNM9_9PROT|nr:siroheme synthase CysG [Rhodovarius crocodyli]RVT99248.1 uroporphyrinogen-III C-methyltransferase [Rhodovarius crocodyli]